MKITLCYQGLCENEKNQVFAYANVKVNVITNANVKHACKCLTLMVLGTFLLICSFMHGLDSLLFLQNGQHCSACRHSRCLIFCFESVFFSCTGGGVLTYWDTRGCDTLMDHFFTRNLKHGSHFPYANVRARNSHMIALHCITKECKVLFTMLWVTEQQCNAMPPLNFRSREVIGLCFTFCNGPEKILNQWKWFLYGRKEETALFPTVFGKTWKVIP